MVIYYKHVTIVKVHVTQTTTIILRVVCYKLIDGEWNVNPLISVNNPLILFFYQNKVFHKHTHFRIKYLMRYKTEF